MRFPGPPSGKNRAIKRRDGFRMRQPTRNGNHAAQFRGKLIKRVWLRNTHGAVHSAAKDSVALSGLGTSWVPPWGWIVWAQIHNCPVKAWCRSDSFNAASAACLRP